MVQGYYTLEEAARVLGIAAEELSKMAQNRTVKAYADKGTWRFRTQDIEELARQMGKGSSPDLQLGDSKESKAQGGTPAKSGEPGTFHFDLGGDADQVEIGQEIILDAGSGGSKGGKSGVRKVGPKSPPPKPGSDSDVRLVADGSDVTFEVAQDSGVKLDSSSSIIRKKTQTKQDSGVRLVPMESESDSDVKIVPDSKEGVSAIGAKQLKSGTDSDIRLDSDKPSGSSLKLGRSPEDSFLTEEIDLDAELRAAEEAARGRKSGAKKPTPPPASPFQLGDEHKKKKDKTPIRKEVTESSSDFDLSLDGDDSSPLEPSSGEMRTIRSKDEEVGLGEMPASSVTGTASDSGINLQEPADSGISLEQGGGDSSEEIEFELSLDAENTPKPAKATPNVDSSSEFELTLEDSARLAPLEEEGGKNEEKDIFETDFEVPALEDESGSQAVALDESDTDLESSDFDLALGEEDAAGEDESASQVVALDDEGEVDEGAATVAKTRKKGGKQAVVDSDEEGEEPAAEEEFEEEGEVAGARAVAVASAPADWGIFAPVVLIFSVIIMFFVGLMSLELVHGMWGYRQTGGVPAMIIKAVGKMGILPGIEDKDLANF